MEEDLTGKTSQKEAERLQYSLRATFFYRRRKDFKNLVAVVNGIDSSQYDWSPPGKLGISSSSLKYVQDNKIDLCQVFCHPDVIVSKPTLIAYYRSLAVLPQKGAQRLAFGVKTLEEGRGKLTNERATRLAKILNNYISSLVDGDPDFTIEGARAVGMMNYGAQLNGSWRNEIGNEGSRRVKELTLKHFLESNLVSKVNTREEPVSPPAAPPPLDDVQGFVATNGYSVVFGSEPDISIISPAGILEGV
ncbi:MAG: XcyI family restriction endonuclease, partial [Thermodesulfobacteriota bacterium]